MTRPTVRVAIQIVKTALPRYVTTLIASVGALINTATLGRHGTASLAAFVVAIAVYGPVVTTVAGVMRGMMPYVVEHENDPRRLGALLNNGLWLGYAVGVVGAITVLSTEHIGRVTGVAEPVLRGLGMLPALLALAVVSQSVGAAASSTLVALGRGRTVMRAGLISTAATVGLSALLVLGPGPLPALGVTGAGTAMLASSVIYTTQAQLALRHIAGLHRTVLPGRPDRREVILLARTGIPMAGTVLVKFTVLGVLTFAAARLGAQQTAVHGVAESLVNLIYTVAVSIGQAVVPMVGQSVRAADLDSARRAVRMGAVVAFLWVGLLGCATVAFGR